MYDNLFQILDEIIKNTAAQQQSPVYKQETPAQVSHPKVFGFWCPEIKRVTFNGNTTIVFFTDGTYAIVKCSAEDKYERKTAVAYAVVKRLFGQLGATDKNGKFHANEVNGAGIGTYLQKIVDNGFDQQLEEKTALEKKRRAKQEHEQRQAAQKQAAFEKRVEERVKQILLERAALDRANEIEDKQRANNKCDSLESACTCKKSKGEKKASSILDTYVRPDKPFSKFTAKEKSEYWKYHNAKKRAQK